MNRKYAHTALATDVRAVKSVEGRKQVNTIWCDTYVVETGIHCRKCCHTIDKASYPSHHSWCKNDIYPDSLGWDFYNVEFPDGNDVTVWVSPRKQRTN